MAKRFTDTEKWKDGWFTDLKPEHKLIWYYLLDNCDNAGIWKLNMKMLNIMCDTNISAEELLTIFKYRLTQIKTDTYLINKFCVYQYGPEFMDSINKAVTSAIDKLVNYGIIYWTGNMIEYTNSKKEIKHRKEYMVSVDNGYSNHTLSIGYQYSMDTPKDKDKAEEQDKFQDEYKMKYIGKGVDNRKYTSEEIDELFNDVN